MYLNNEAPKTWSFGVAERAGMRCYPQQQQTYAMLQTYSSQFPAQLKRT